MVILALFSFSSSHSNIKLTRSFVPVNNEQARGNNNRPEKKLKAKNCSPVKSKLICEPAAISKNHCCFFQKSIDFFENSRFFFFTKNSKRSKISFKITTINILIYNVFLHSVEKFPLDMIAEKYVYHSSNCSYLVASFSYLIQ